MTPCEHTRFRYCRQNRWPYCSTTAERPRSTRRRDAQISNEHSYPEYRTKKEEGLIFIVTSADGLFGWSFIVPLRLMRHRNRSTFPDSLACPRHQHTKNISPKSGTITSQLFDPRKVGREVVFQQAF